MWHPHITHMPRHLIFLRVLPSFHNFSHRNFGVSIILFFLGVPVKFLQAPFFKLETAFSDSLWEQVHFSGHIYSPRDLYPSKISIFPSNADLWTSAGSRPTSHIPVAHFLSCVSQTPKDHCVPNMLLSLPCLSVKYTSALPDT